MNKSMNSARQLCIVVIGLLFCWALGAQLHGGLLILVQGAPAGLTLGGAGQPGHDQAVRVRSAVILRHLARIEHANNKSKLARPVPSVRIQGRNRAMEALTPASPDRLPPLGELIAGEPFWRYPIGPTDREGVAHLRVWLTAGRQPGHLAVVTQTGSAASVTESAGQIWAEFARRVPGPRSCCSSITRRPRPGKVQEETLNLVRIGADGSPHWLGVLADRRG